MRVYREFDKLHDALMWLIRGSRFNKKRNDLKHNMDLLVAIEKKIEEMWNHKEFTFKASNDYDRYQVELFSIAPEGYCRDRFVICNEYDILYIPYWDKTVNSHCTIEFYNGQKDN